MAFLNSHLNLVRVLLIFLNSQKILSSGSGSSSEGSSSTSSSSSSNLGSSGLCSSKTYSEFYVSDICESFTGSLLSYYSYVTSLCFSTLTIISSLTCGVSASSAYSSLNKCASSSLSESPPSLLFLLRLVLAGRKPKSPPVPSVRLPKIG